VDQRAKCLPLGQVMKSGSWDQTPSRAPRSTGSLLLPLHLLLPLFVLSLSQTNKQNLQKKKNLPSSGGYFLQWLISLQQPGCRKAQKIVAMSTGPPLPLAAASEVVGASAPGRGQACSSHT